MKCSLVDAISKGHLSFCKTTLMRNLSVMDVKFSFQNFSRINVFIYFLNVSIVNILISLLTVYFTNDRVQT